MEDSFLLSSVKDEAVEVEMLEYSYVEKSTNIDELKAIYRVLRSGREGRFEALENFVKKRLMSILPEEDALRWKSMLEGPSFDDERNARKDVESFLNDIRLKNSSLAASKSTTSTSSSPPQVRSTVVHNSAPKENSTIPKRDSKAMPFSEYYNKWDKFDVDAALNSMDTANIEVDPTPSSVARIKEINSDSEEETIIRESKPAAKIVEDFSSMPLPEREMRAAREKKKGNEAYTANSYEEAIDYYSKSLQYLPTGEHAAIVLGNRSQVHLKLNQYASAEADAEEALRIDPNLPKITLRLSTAKMHRGKYTEAFQSANSLMSHSDKSIVSQATQLIKEIKEKAKKAGETIDENKKAPKAVSVHNKDTNSVPPSTASSTKKAVKVPIVMESDSEDESMPAATVPQPVPTTAPVSAPKAKKITILEEEEEGVPPAVSLAELGDIKSAGVDAFKSGDYDSAAGLFSRVLDGLGTYSGVEVGKESGSGDEARSLALAALGNRSMCALRLGDFAAAIRDCDRLLNTLGFGFVDSAEFSALSPTDAAANLLQRVEAAQTPAGEVSVLVKTLWRRATAKKDLKKCSEAAKDFSFALALEPSNERITKDSRENAALLAAEKRSQKAVAPPPVPSESKPLNSSLNKIQVLEESSTSASPAPTSKEPAKKKIMIVEDSESEEEKPSENHLQQEPSSSRKSPQKISIEIPLPGIPKSVFELERALLDVSKNPTRFSKYLAATVVDEKATVLTQLYKSKKIETQVFSLFCNGIRQFLDSFSDATAAVNTLNNIAANLKVLMKNSGFGLVKSMLLDEEKNSIIHFVKLCKQNSVNVDGIEGIF